MQPIAAANITSISNKSEIAAALLRDGRGPITMNGSRDAIELNFPRARTMHGGAPHV